MTDFNAQVSSALIAFMQEHGVTQTRVGELLGRSQSYVSHRLTGKNDLSVDIIGAVAELAGVTPIYLVDQLVRTVRQGDQPSARTRVPRR